MNSSACDRISTTAANNPGSAKPCDMDFLRPDPEVFESCPAESIDYAVMEKTDNAMVMPMDPQWNDLGSWSALLDLLPKNGDGNVQMGDVIGLNSANNYIHAEHKLVGTLGVRGSGDCRYQGCAISCT